MQILLLTMVLCAALAFAHWADAKIAVRVAAKDEGYKALALPTFPPEEEPLEADAAKAPGKLDLNTADAWMLQAIPGVGEVMAQRIIDYRTENDGFFDVRELLRIAGIGEKLYDVLVEHVEVRAAEEM